MQILNVAKQRVCDRKSRNFVLLPKLHLIHKRIISLKTKKVNIFRRFSA